MGFDGHSRSMAEWKLGFEVVFWIWGCDDHLDIIILDVSLPLSSRALLRLECFQLVDVSIRLTYSTLFLEWGMGLQTTGAMR